MKNTWVELYLDTLRTNIDAVRRAVGASTALIAVVKSRAYGHGLTPVTTCLWACGVRWFAVAHLDEGLALRERLPEAHILIVGVIDPADVAAAAAAHLLPVLVDGDHAAAVACAAQAAGTALDCHVKIDTGMGRLGFSWQDAAASLERVRGLHGIALRGICTHLSCSDEAEAAFTRVQVDRFRGVLAGWRMLGGSPLFRHIANSGGVLCGAARDMDGVRPGILIYGYHPSGLPMAPGTPSGGGARVETRPFLQWKTRVVQVKRVPAGFPVGYGRSHITERETHIATIDVGYADGYSRRLGNRGWVLAGGRRCRVVGRVTMNLTTIDLGAASEVRPGDEVVLLGAQGSESVWADELAFWADTISYEVLTAIRVDERRLVSGNALTRLASPLC